MNKKKYKVIANFAHIHEDNNILKKPIDLFKNDIHEFTTREAEYINKVSKKIVIVEAEGERQ